MNEILITYLSIVAADTYGCNVYGGGSYSESNCQELSESASSPSTQSDSTSPSAKKPSTSPQTGTQTTGSTIQDTSKPTPMEMPFVEPVVLAAAGSVFVASGLMFFITRLRRKNDKS